MQSSARRQRSVVERKQLLESTVADALRASSQLMSVGKDTAFAITSAEDGETYSLLPEDADVPSAYISSKRRLGWVSGRAAAYRTLKDLGVTNPTAIGRGCAGEPIWPHGISGSITHCYPWSVAVATRSSGCLSLGIDLESMQRIRKIDVGSVICRKNEREWIGAGSDSDKRLCMIFSAKEAVYKSLFPSYRRYIDFQEVELSWCKDKASFYAAVLPAVEECAQGRLSYIPSQECDDLIFSCAVYELQQIV